MYIENNNIHDLTQLKNIQRCKQIQRLWFQSQSGSNPICKNNDYLDTLYKYVAVAVKSIDEKAVNDEDRKKIATIQANIVLEPFLPIVIQPTVPDVITVNPVIVTNPVITASTNVAQEILELRKQNAVLLEKQTKMEKQMEKQTALLKKILGTLLGPEGIDDEDLK